MERSDLGVVSFIVRKVKVVRVCFTVTLESVQRQIWGLLERKWNSVQYSVIPHGLKQSLARVFVVDDQLELRAAFLLACAFTKR